MESVSLGEPASLNNNNNNIPPPPPYTNEPSAEPSAEPATVVDSKARLQQRLFGAFAIIIGASILCKYLWLALVIILISS